MTSLQEKLKTLPDNPGVYIMKDRDNNIIYIGKAISLKNRVRQYFQSSRNHTPKVRAMVSNIYDFEYILTDSEMEALILECNLIKKHRPKYNILLKDDKHYPYIKVTTEESYPRVLMVRRISKDKNKYFGPYTSSRAVRETIELIKQIFPIRSCNRNIDGNAVKDRPCLYYHMGKCLGPCQGNVDKGEYDEMVKQICKFLDGRHEDIIKELNVEMEKASEDLQFEKAALIRDRIRAVEQIMERQKIISTDMEDKDILGFVQGKDRCIAQVFFVRKGKLIGSQHYILDDSKDSDLAEVMTSFIKQFYLVSSFIPREILIQQSIDESDLIGRWLSDKRGSKVNIHAPVRGEKKKLVNLAIKNAQDVLENIEHQMEREKGRTEGASIELAEYLGLDSVPYRIEAFDISHIQGTDTVASMVVFEGGKPKKKDYRRFKIKSLQEGVPNDFASMIEVVGRRFRRGLNERRELESQGKDPNYGKFSRFPDLILIDGGKGQLNSAMSVLREMDMDSIPIIGLAERFEEVYVPFKSDPVVIPKDSNALHLLERIRDEAHRFAITYHRSLHGKNNLRSVLEDIPGIGPKRRIALFNRFGSIDAIKKASVEELCEVPGMNKTAAQSIKEYFEL